MPVRKTLAASRGVKPESGPHSLHHKLAQSIGEQILKGIYAPGAILPNEADWCRIYGASRTAVREAIKTLHGKGLLASRPKIGSRVEPRERWNLLDRDVIAWHFAAMDRRAFMNSTQEARKIFEPGIAALAAEKRTPAQLARLEAALDAMRTAKSGLARVAPDVEFHLAMLAAANNELLSSFGLIIEWALPAVFDYSTRHNPRPESIVPLHEEVVGAIRRGNAEAARRAVSALLRDTDKAIEQGLVGGPRKARPRKRG
jgi:DNA-binding FadR family transcriptional regulator